MALPPPGPWTGPPIYGGVPPPPPAHQGYGYAEVGFILATTICNHRDGEVEYCRPDVYYMFYQLLYNIGTIFLSSVWSIFSFSEKKKLY